MPYPARGALTLGWFPQVGCEDGSVKLLRVGPDRIQFERQLDRQKGRGTVVQKAFAGGGEGAGEAKAFAFSAKFLTSGSKLKTNRAETGL